MSDTRAAIRELRSLSEKRSTQGLTEQERSRLAELRERLGLPSEPALAGSPGGEAFASDAGTTAAQTEGPTPRAAVPAPPTSPSLGGAGSAEPSESATPGFPGPGALPGLQTAVSEQAALPRFDSLPPTTALPGVEVDEPGPVLPDLALPPGAAPQPTPPELDASAQTPEPGADAAGPIRTLQDLAADASAEPGRTAPESEPSAHPPEVLKDREPRAGGEESAATPPGLEASAAGPDTDLGREPSEALDLGASAEPGPLSPWRLADATLESPVDATAVEAAPLPPDAPLPGEQPSAEPRRPSLAERIDAAVVASEDQGPEDAESSWAAVPPEPELGATPLDVAEPSDELAFLDPGAPIELSSAEVVLLETEAGDEPELAGHAGDRVPLAELHEFIGEQPESDEALVFDDQGEQPTFEPGDLLGSGAELANAGETFHPGAARDHLDLPPEPPPPAAPRITVPRPPAGPPLPRTVPAPVAPPAPRAVVPPAPPPPPPAALSPPAPAQSAPRTPSVTGPIRAPVPAPAPPAAGFGVLTPPPAARHVGGDRPFALGDDGRRVPALSQARPEPPQLATSFANSGPFARPQALLLTPAPLDVMEDGESPPRGPAAPTTDVASGAEMFGGSSLSPTFVEGEHRVVLHTLEGQVRRGTVRDIDLLDPVIRLAQPGRPPEVIPSERVKAIFFMQEPGVAPLPSVGRRIRVGFGDGRQIVGFSEDVDAAEQGFFLVPADTRTHTARIYVFRAGVQSISAG